MTLGSAARGVPERSAACPATPSVQHLESGPRPATVRVAEDDAAIRLTLEVMFSSEGYRVLATVDGLEAVARYAGGKSA